MGGPLSPRLPGGQFIAAASASGRALGEVFGDQAGLAEAVGALAMEPRRRCCRGQRRQALGHQAGRESRQHVARSGGRQRGRRMDIDDRPSVGSRDHRIGSLEQDRGAAHAGRPAAHASTLPGTPARSGNRRRNSPSCGVSKTGRESPRTGATGSSAKTVTASASSTTARPRRQRREHGVARALVHAGARADQEGVAALVVERVARRRAVVGVDDQVAGLGHAVDRRRRRRRRDGRKARPCPAGRERRQPRRARRRGAAQDREMAAGVFVVAGIVAPQGVRPQRRLVAPELRRRSRREPTVECRYRRPAIRRTGAGPRGNNGRAWHGRKSP